MTVPADVDLESRVLGAALAGDLPALRPLLADEQVWWQPAHARLATWLAGIPDGTYAVLRYDLFAGDAGAWRWTIPDAPSDLTDTIDKCRSVATPTLYVDALRLSDLALRRVTMRTAAECYAAAADPDTPLDNAFMLARAIA
jgi:hypothetical protein